MTEGLASASPVEARGGRDPAPARPASTDALYFYGVTRARMWRSRSRAEADGVLRIRYRDIEALVRHAVFETPSLDDATLAAHQRVLESAMRNGTVLPAPFGIVFSGRRPLLRMLQDQYDALNEGLHFLDGHWELRIHISRAREDAAEPLLSDLAMQLYSELRRGVRAAVPFPRENNRLLSAAFLVERSAWLDFMQRADDLGIQHPELSFDITGPWPAYDFVRLGD